MDSSKLGTLFGKRLRDLRTERGLLQEEVGSWFKMQKSTVSQWESGRVPHATIIAELARRFHVSADYLLGLSHACAVRETPETYSVADPADDLPPEARERIEEIRELMRIKYGKKT